MFFRHSDKCAYVISMAALSWNKILSLWFLNKNIARSDVLLKNISEQPKITPELAFLKNELQRPYILTTFSRSWLPAIPIINLGGKLNIN